MESNKMVNKMPTQNKPTNKTKQPAQKKAKQPTEEWNHNKIKCKKCKNVFGVRPDVLQKRMEKAKIKTFAQMEQEYMCRSCRPAPVKTHNKPANTKTSSRKVKQADEDDDDEDEDTDNDDEDGDDDEE